VTQPKEYACLSLKMVYFTRLLWPVGFNVVEPRPSHCDWLQLRRWCFVCVAQVTIHLSSTSTCLSTFSTASCLLPTVCSATSDNIITSTMRLPLLTDAVRALSFSPGPQKVFSGSHRDDVTTLRLAERPELPGGTPMSLCSESSPTDLFNVSSVQLSKQPLYMYVPCPAYS
jgi:hypothetical protein